MIHFIFSLLRWWYFVPTLVTTSFLLDFLISKSIFNSKPQSFIKYYKFLVISISTLSLISSTFILLRFLEDSQITKKFTNDINFVLESNERIFVFDTSGILAWRFLPNINVVNGDGLINNFDYYDNYLKDKKNLDSYFKSNKIKYYIKNTKGKCPNPTLDYCSDLFMKSKLIISSRSESKTTGFKLFKIQD